MNQMDPAAAVYLSFGYVASDNADVVVQTNAGDDLLRDTVTAFEETDFQITEDVSKLEGGFSRCLIEDPSFPEQVNIDFILRLCRLMDKLSLSRWMFCTQMSLYPASDKTTLFMRHLDTSNERQFGAIFANPDDISLVVPGDKSTSGSVVARRLNGQLEHLLKKKVTIMDATSENYSIIQFECPWLMDDIEFFMEILIITIKALHILGFDIEGNTDLLGDKSNVILFSKSNLRIKRSSKFTIFGMTPENSGFKLFNAPNDIKRIVSQEFKHYKKSEVLWQRKSRQGKRIAMSLMSELQRHRCHVLCSLEHLSKHSLFLLYRDHPAVAPQDLLNTSAMMSISIASGKKLQPDFANSKGFYVGGAGGHLEPFVRDALSALSASNGTFEHHDRVVRYPEGTFDSESSFPGTVALVILRVLEKLDESKWRILISGNISGYGRILLKNSDSVTCHTLFLVQYSGIQVVRAADRILYRHLGNKISYVPGQNQERPESYRLSMTDESSSSYHQGPSDEVPEDHNHMATRLMQLIHSASVPMNLNAFEDAPPSYDEAMRAMKQ